MGLPSVGDWVPLVTTPLRPRRRHGSGSRGGRCRGRARRARRAGAATPSRATFSSAARPTKSPGLSSLTTRPEARLERVRRLGRARCRRAACRPRAGACRGRRGRRAPGRAAAPGLEQRVPQLHRPSVVDEHLEAVLAGVAGPRDQRRDAGHARPRRSRSSASAPRSTSVSGPTISTARGPWMATRPWRASGRRGPP